MLAVCTMVMLEIFIYAKHIFNLSPYDEVIGKLGKKNLLLQLSDYRSAIFDSSLGDATKNRECLQ